MFFIRKGLLGWLTGAWGGKWVRARARSRQGCDLAPSAPSPGLLPAFPHDLLFGCWVWDHVVLLGPCFRFFFFPFLSFPSFLAPEAQGVVVV